jgi:hypothetical protein
MILFNRFIATLFAAIGLLSLAAPLVALGQTTPLNIGADLPKRLAIWQSLQTLADPAGTYLPDQVASKMRAAVQQGTAQYLACRRSPRQIRLPPLLGQLYPGKPQRRSAKLGAQF